MKKFFLGNVACYAIDEETKNLNPLGKSKIMKWFLFVPFSLFILLSCSQLSLPEQAEEENSILDGSVDVPFHLEEIQGEEEPKPEHLADEDFSNITCEEIPIKMRELSKLYNDCEKDADCVHLAIRGNCECLIRPKEIHFGLSVPIKYRFFKILDDKFFSSECGKYSRCCYHCFHGKEAYLPVCREQKCTLEELFPNVCR